MAKRRPCCAVWDGASIVNSYWRLLKNIGSLVTYIDVCSCINVYKYSFQDICSSKHTFIQTNTHAHTYATKQTYNQPPLYLIFLPFRLYSTRVLAKSRDERETARKSEIFVPHGANFATRYCHLSWTIIPSLACGFGAIWRWLGLVIAGVEGLIWAYLWDRIRDGKAALAGEAALSVGGFFSRWPRCLTEEANGVKGSHKKSFFFYSGKKQ